MNRVETRAAASPGGRATGRVGPGDYFEAPDEVDQLHGILDGGRPPRSNGISATAALGHHRERQGDLADSAPAGLAGYDGDLGFNARPATPIGDRRGAVRDGRVAVSAISTAPGHDRPA